MVVEFTRIALKRKRKKKSLEKIRFGSRIARDVQFETKNADFLLGISFYAVSIQKKKYVQVTNRNNGSPIITFFLFACLFQKEEKGARKSSGSTVVLAENLRSSDETECTSVPVVAISTNGRNRCCRTCGTSADSLRASNVLTAPWKTTKNLTWSVTYAYIILNSRKRSGTESSVLSFDFNFNISTSIVVLSIVARNKASWWIDGKKKRVKKEKKRKEKQYLFLPLYTRSIGSIAVHLGAWQTPSEIRYFNRLLDILRLTSDLSMAGCKVWMLGGKMVPRDPCASTDHVHARSLICCYIARTPILSEPIEKSVSVNCEHVSLGVSKRESGRSARVET